MADLITMKQKIPGLILEGRDLEREVEEIWGPGSIERVILHMLDENSMSGQPNRWKASEFLELHHGSRQRTTAKVVHFPTGLPVGNPDQDKRR